MNEGRVAPWSVVLVLALAAAGCSKMEPPSATHVVAAAPQAQAASGLPAADRAMRITVDTSVQVGDVDAAASAVRAAVARAGGYVGEARTSGADEARSAAIEAHVPVANLPAFRGEIAKLGDTASDAEKAEDVTEQRADISARLSNARAEEKRLLELLDKRTGSLADVVAVEKELASVRETVERMEAQERVIVGQIASATVRIQLSERTAAARLGAGRRIGQAAIDGVHNAGAFVVGLAVVTASAGPTVLLLAAIGYAIFVMVRFIARRTQPRPAR